MKLEVIVFIGFGPRYLSQGGKNTIGLPPGEGTPMHGPAACACIGPHFQTAISLMTPFLTLLAYLELNDPPFFIKSFMTHPMIIFFYSMAPVFFLFFSLESFTQ